MMRPIAAALIQPADEDTPPAFKAPLFQSVVANVEVEKLPALPESRPDSPTQESPALGDESRMLFAHSIAKNTERVLPTDTQAALDLGLDVKELPSLPESRPESPAQDIAAEESFMPLESPAEEDEQPVAASATRAVVHLQVDKLPALPESRPASPSVDLVGASIDETVHDKIKTLAAVPGTEGFVEQTIGTEGYRAVELSAQVPLPEDDDGSLTLETAPTETLKPSKAGSANTLEVPSAALRLPLPESCPASPIEPAPVFSSIPHPIAEEVSAKPMLVALHNLPTLPESRPGSPETTKESPVEAEPQPAVAPQETVAEKTLSPNQLPALPESRPGSPAEDLEKLPEDSPEETQVEKETTASFEPPGLSQEPTIQVQDFAQPASDETYEPPATYDELLFQKKIPDSPTTARAREKEAELEAAEERIRSTPLPEAALATAAATNAGLVVARMQQSETTIPSLKVERLEEAKLGLDSNPEEDNEPADSVSSFNEDASTVAASEAPTYLSGSTFFESQHDGPGKLDDSPPRPGTLSFLLGNRRGSLKSQATSRVDLWTPASPQISRDKRKASDVRPIPEVAEETTTTRAAITEQGLGIFIKDKAKGKANKKEVSWTDSEPPADGKQPQTQGERERSASVGDDALSSQEAPQPSGDTAKQPGSSILQHVELSKSRRHTRSVSDVGSTTKPASNDAGSQKQQSKQSGDQREGDSASVSGSPRLWRKKNLWGSSLSVLPSLAGGVGSLFGITGKGPATSSREKPVQKQEVHEQPESRKSLDDEPPKHEAPKQQELEPQQDKPSQPLDAASKEETASEPGESSSKVPAAEQASDVNEPTALDESSPDTAARTLQDTGASPANEESSVPEEPPRSLSAAVEGSADEAKPVDADADAVGAAASVEPKTAGVTELAPSVPEPSDIPQSVEQEGVPSQEVTQPRSPSLSATTTLPDDNNSQPQPGQQPPADTPVATDQGGESAPDTAEEEKPQDLEVTPKDAPTDEPVIQETQSTELSVVDGPEQQITTSPATVGDSANPDDLLAANQPVDAEPTTKKKKKSKGKKKKVAEGVTEATSMSVEPAQPEESQPESMPPSGEQPQEEEQSETVATVAEDASAPSTEVEASAQGETPSSGKKKKKKRKKRADSQSSEVVAEPTTAAEAPVDLSVAEDPVSQDSAPSTSSLLPESTTNVPADVPEAVVVETLVEVETSEPAAEVSAEVEASTSEAVQSAPEPEAVPSLGDDRPATPGSQEAQKEASTPQDPVQSIPETPSKKKKKKKKRHSVTFAEPLEEHLVSTGARGEDKDNQRSIISSSNKQEAQDSKDPTSEVPVGTPSQEADGEGESVSEEPAVAQQQEAEADGRGLGNGDVGVSVSLSLLSDAHNIVSQPHGGHVSNGKLLPQETTVLPAPQPLNPSTETELVEDGESRAVAGEGK
jgi:hypothetical protein